MYVQRKNGKVIGIYAVLQPGYAEENLADDDIEVMAHLDWAASLGPDGRDIFVEMDRLTAALISRGTITRDDLEARARP